jgi:hypothetical protein
MEYLRTSTLVPWYIHVFVRTMVCTYTYTYRTECTRVQISQIRLEIQALRCNGDTTSCGSGRCQHRRHHGILQLRFQLDSDVCSNYTYTMVFTLCRNFLIACALRTTCVHTGTVPLVRVPWYVHMYVQHYLKRLTMVLARVRTVHVYQGSGPRRRLSDPGVLQRTVTPRRRAQGGDAGSGSYPRLHARRHCSGGRPRHRGSGVRAVARV